MPFFDATARPGPTSPGRATSNHDFIPELRGELDAPESVQPFHLLQRPVGRPARLRRRRRTQRRRGPGRVPARGNIYKYNIYDAGSQPIRQRHRSPPTAAWTPALAVRGQHAHDHLHAQRGTAGRREPSRDARRPLTKTAGRLAGCDELDMTVSRRRLVSRLPGPERRHLGGLRLPRRRRAPGTTTTRLASAGRRRQPTATSHMDGVLDSEDYEVFRDGGKMESAPRSRETTCTSPPRHRRYRDGNDHFIYVTDELGDAIAPPLGQGRAVFWTPPPSPTWPAKATTTWTCLAQRQRQRPPIAGGRRARRRDQPGRQLRLRPGSVYIAAVAYGDDDGDASAARARRLGRRRQHRPSWSSCACPSPASATRTIDGYFDGGKPQMWTVVDGNTNDANYGLRRFFLNELAGDRRDSRSS